MDLTCKQFSTEIPAVAKNSLAISIACENSDLCKITRVSESGEKFGVAFGVILASLFTRFWVDFQSAVSIL